MRHRTTDTPKGHRNYVIIACDVLLFLAMLKWLPVEPEVARGLAVLTFIGILWLTEALHVTVTSLLVPGDGPDSDFPGYGVSFHVDVQYGHGCDDAPSGYRPFGPHSSGKT